MFGFAHCFDINKMLEHEGGYVAYTDGLQKFREEISKAIEHLQNLNCAYYCKATSDISVDVITALEL
jgi:hypothetical protein